MNPNELLAERATLLNNGRAILDKAQAEKRELTAEERQAYDRIWADAQAKKDAADKLIGDQNRRQQLDAAMADLSNSTGRIARPAPIAAGNDGANLTAPYAFKFARPGDWDGQTGRRRRLEQSASLEYGSPAWRRHQQPYRDDMRAYLQTGRIGASLQTDLSTQGGYMVLPEQFVSELLMNVDDQRWIRQLARTFTTNAQTLGVVKRTAKMATFAWGSELTDASTAKDTTLAYGKRSLTPHYMTGAIDVSRDLLRSALLPVEEYVRYEIARDSGELEENAFLTGSGAQRPLGLFTASNDGIDTSRDVSTGNSATAIGADNLRQMKYALKPQYRAHPSLSWLFHRDAVKQISLLKDGMGQYLWRDGITVGDPDTILGIPMRESEFTPNTFTTGLYVGLLGAFNWYWIVDSLEMDIQVLVEVLAATNQVRYVCRRKTDGMPQLAEAFVRCKLG